MAYTPIIYPAWAYNATQPARLVNSAADFAALPAPGLWSFTPATFVVPPASLAPADPGLTTTDTRLSQQLIEARITNLILAAGLLPGAGGADDPVTVLRADVTANDASLTS